MNTENLQNSTHENIENNSHCQDLLVNDRSNRHTVETVCNAHVSSDAYVVVDVSTKQVCSKEMITSKCLP